MYFRRRFRIDLHSCSMDNFPHSAGSRSVGPAPTKTFLHPPEEGNYENEVLAFRRDLIARGIFIQPEWGFFIRPTRSVGLEYTARATHARNPLGSRVQPLCPRRRTKGQ